MSELVVPQSVALCNVSKRYSHFNLENLNLSLPQGQVLGLVGPNGAGKSTCLRLMMGLLRPDSGEINVLGRAVPEHAVWLKERAAFVSEDMRLFADKTIDWHMGFIKQLFSRWDEVYAQQLLRNFELQPQQKIKELSLGQRIKATLLLALARRPQLLVLDEPSTGLDPIARYELTSQLFDIMLNEENSVVFSSQFTQDVERLSDSIAFMDRGQLIAHQDKETYLDRWRRVELKGDGILPPMDNVIDITPHAGGCSFTHAQFDQRAAEHFTQLGFNVTHAQPLTLEEIFIHQVRYSRQQSKVKANA